MHDVVRIAGGRFYDRWIVEPRARAIADPVAKLRYLQGALGAGIRPRRLARRRLRPWHGKAVALASLLLLPLPTVSNAVFNAGLVNPPRHAVDLSRPRAAPSVWLVEESGSHEVYSNGLRIENRFAVANLRRDYPVYRRDTLELVEWRSGPVGIVYHTTESQQAPFDLEHNRRLKNLNTWLLEFVQRKRAYHFVIDRFGRVHRVVRESDTANHAGYSVWADDRYVYVNLNPSFVGVSFETETRQSSAGAAINRAQIHAAKVLTEMLRSRYGIALENCVTHAQVSVFPRALLVGNHTDWAAGFPFAEIGLGDNYRRPLAAVAIFGFDYGLEYLDATGADLWRGLAFGEDVLRQEAHRHGLPVAAYRKARKSRYREILKVIEETVSSQESES